MAHTWYVPTNPETATAAPKKAEKFKHWGNPDIAKAMHGLRTSNAAGKHQDRRTKRNRDRSAQNRNAVRDFS